jgi:hypothetical protein
VALPDTEVVSGCSGLTVLAVTAAVLPDDASAGAAPPMASTAAAAAPMVRIAFLMMGTSFLRGPVWVLYFISIRTVKAL